MTALDISQIFVEYVLHRHSKLSLTYKLVVVEVIVDVQVVGVVVVVVDVQNEVKVEVSTEIFTSVIMVQVFDRSLTNDFVEISTALSEPCSPECL